jgi:hypothetical protein
MKTIEQLIAEADACIKALREQAIEPFTLNVSEDINIEIRPACEGDRVTVGRTGWGDAIVNFTNEGLILDVYGQDEPLDPLHTICIERSDLQGECSEGEAGQDVYAGYVNADGTRIDLEFAVPAGASQQAVDAAAFGVLAMKAEVDVLRVS